MSSQSHLFPATLGTFKLAAVMIIGACSVIGTVTAASNLLSTQADLIDYSSSTDYKTLGHNFRISKKHGGNIIKSGQFKVPLPDGRTQITTYTADERGYRPVVTYEQTVQAKTTVPQLDRASVPSSGSTRSENCNILPSPGECRGAFPRFFFNSTSSQCDCFLYGGCDDEEATNSWLTLEQCSTTCLPDNTKPGPRCKVASKPEVQTFTSKPRPRPVIAETPDVSNLTDLELLNLFDIN